MRGVLTKDLTKRLAIYFVMSAWPIVLSFSLLSLVAPREHYIDIHLRCHAVALLKGSAPAYLALGPLGVALPISRTPYWGMEEALVWVVVCVLLINAPVVAPGAKGLVLALVGAAIWFTLGFASLVG